MTSANHFIINCRRCLERSRILCLSLYANVLCFARERKSEREGGGQKRLTTFPRLLREMRLCTTTRNISVTSIVSKRLRDGWSASTASMDAG